MASNKNNATADKLRDDGNTFFREGKYFDSIIKYNESLCRAETGSEKIAFAYANRSAVFMELKMYEKCLKNIQQAKDAGYPQEKIQTLNDRCERATKMLAESPPAASQKDPFEFIKLSYPAYSKNPEIVGCLELAENEKYGRHIRANRDLKAGDVVAIEKHYVKVLHGDLMKTTPKEHILYQYCANCLDTNKMDLIPCDGCTTTMYCNEECKKQAFDESHRYECEIRDKLQSMSNSVALTLNVFFKGLVACNDSIDELKKLSANHLYDQQKSTVFNFDFTNMSAKEAEKANLLILLSGATCLLTSNEMKVYLAKILSVLESHSIGKKLTASHRSFLEDFMLKTFSISLATFYSLKMSDSNPLVEGLTFIGDGNSLFSSLISHSCAPNVAYGFIGNKSIILVIESIKKGAQICTTYGPRYYFDEKEKRQENMLRAYQFKCTCKACENDWPLDDGLKVSDKQLGRFFNNDIQPLMRDPTKTALITPEEAWNKIRDYCNKIEETLCKYRYQQPTFEVYAVHCAIAYLLQIVGDNTIKIPAP